MGLDRPQIIGAHEDVPRAPILTVNDLNKCPGAYPVEFPLKADMQVAGAMPEMNIERCFQKSPP